MNFELILHFLGIIGQFQSTLFLLLLFSPIFAIIDMSDKEFTGNNKLYWLILVIALNFFGTALYFFIGRKQVIKE